MSCVSLTKGYKSNLCMNSNPGGIKAIGVAVFEQSITNRPTGGILTTLPTAITEIFRLEMKNNGVTFSEVLAQDGQNRTNTYTSTLTAIISSLDNDVHQLLHELAGGEMFVFVEKNDNSIILMGAEYGAMTSGITATVNGELSAGQNASITFTSVERMQHLILDSSAITAYRTLVQN